MLIPRHPMEAKLLRLILEKGGEVNLLDMIRVIQKESIDWKTCLSSFLKHHDIQITLTSHEESQEIRIIYRKERKNPCI